MIQWILKDPAGLQSIKLFNGILDKGQRCAAIISCPWSLQQLQWQREALGIVGYWLGGVSRWDCRSSRGGLIEMFPDGDFCCPAKRDPGRAALCTKAAPVLLWRCWWGKEDGDKVLVTVPDVLPTLCSLPWPPQPRLRDVLFSQGSGEMFVRAGGAEWIKRQN